MDLILWRHADAESSSPDSARKLTERGCEQAQRMAAWLKPRVPVDCRVLASPAARAQQTAAALGLPFVISPALGTDAVAADVLAAADWPERPGTVMIVGHQPTLGRVAALLLSGRDSDWNIGKGALWWLRNNRGDVTLRAAIDPELLLDAERVDPD
jgi:phosphohistidine phosphatase